MAPMLLHLMRHGEPVIAGRLLGHSDVPATPEGIAACRSAAASLTDVAAIVTSDLSRAAACAEAAAQAATLGVRVDARWRELDFGAWDGCAAADLPADALARFWDDPDVCPPPGGETRACLLARVAAAVADLDGETLVVTHAGTMRAALSVLCGFDSRQVWAFDLPYAAVLTLALWRPDGGGDGRVGGQVRALRA